MEKADLGDRYNNPLKYLTNPNLEGNSDIESPNLTELSDPEQNSINTELISMLDTLSLIVNLENRHQNSSNVFIPPSEFKEADLVAKISFIHSLTQSISTYISTGAFKFNHLSKFYQRDSEEILENTPAKVKKDVITKLINCGDGVFLNHNDLKQLSALLIGSCRDSAKDSVKDLSNVSRSKLENKKKEYKELSNEIDALNIGQEKMILENSKLRKE